MTSEVALVLKADCEPGSIPAVEAEIVVEINAGVVQSVCALSRLPFPIKVHIKDLDLSRVEPHRTQSIWLLRLAGKSP